MIRLPMLDGVGNGAAVSLDFINSKYILNPSTYTTPASIPSWSFTRASTGYALNSSGALVSFGSGVPRITDLGFLVEAAATNNIKQSQALATTPWAATAGVAANNALAAPDGTLTATSFTEDSTNASHELLQSVSFTTSSTATFSAYAKAGSRSQVILIFGSGFVTGSASVVYNLTGSGSIVTTGTITGTITPLANGWYFLTATATSNTGNTAGNMFLGPGVANSVSYQGNGSLSAYFWGVQFEQGASATSYIPTTSSTATRAADVATISGLPSSLSQSGTLVGVFTPSYLSGTAGTPGAPVATFGVSGGVEMRLDNSPGIGRGLRANVASVVTTANAGTVVATNKLALSYIAGSYLMALNGGTVATGSDAVALTSSTAITLGRDQAGDALNGYLQRFTVYATTSASSQVQGFTQ